MNRTLLRLALASAAALLLASSAEAQSPATTSLNVSANVKKACTVSATAIDFGEIDFLIDSGDTGTGTVSVTCTKGVAYNLSFGPGLHPGGTTGRTMVRDLGADSIEYSLSYTDTSAAVGISVDRGGTSTTSKAAKDYELTAAIATDADASPGAYSDVVQVTVTF